MWNCRPTQGVESVINGRVWVNLFRIGYGRIAENTYLFLNVVATANGHGRSQSRLIRTQLLMIVFC